MFKNIKNKYFELRNSVSKNKLVLRIRNICEILGWVVCFLLVMVLYMEFDFGRKSLWIGILSYIVLYFIGEICVMIYAFISMHSKNKKKNK